MPVYPHMVLYARHVNAKREYFDLVCLPGAEPIWGVFDQSGGDGSGLWRERFDEAEALQRLRKWPMITPSPGAGRLPRSYRTSAGEQWLASIT